MNDKTSDTTEEVSKDPRQEEKHPRAIYLKGYREGFQASQKMCSAIILGKAEEIENEEVKYILRRLSKMLIILE